MTLEVRSLLHNRYRIEQIIAQGGMGAIYRATDESLGVQVAVKENLFTTEESTRQFRREATILAGLRHANLPRVTDHFVIPDHGQYLVMDFIDGEDLRQKINQEGKLAEVDVVFYGTVICDALAYLHSRQPAIVHRDIKPGNIKITSSKQVYLVDFGLAKMSQTGQSTTVGAQALTPGFAPPEQYGKGTDPRSDIYSLAATLYASLTAQIPEDALARALGSAQLTPIRKHNPKVNERTAQVIEKAMSVDILKRYQTVGEFKQALLNANTIARQRSAQMENTLATGITPTPNQAPTTFRPAASASVSRKAPPKFPVIPVLIGGFLLFAFAGVVILILAGTTLLSRGVPTPVLTLTSEIVDQPTENPTPEPTITPEPTQTPESTLTQQPLVLESTAVLTPQATNTPQPSPTYTQAVTPVGGGGGEIAFASNRSGSFQIWKMAADGSKPVQITNLPDGACQPSWSPDGKRLIFTSPCKGKQETYQNAGLFVINIDGTGLNVLRSQPGGDFDPAWSPDGDRIAFASLREGNPHIFVFNFVDQTTIRLSSQSTRDIRPAWSLDGKLIAFETTRQGVPQIWTINATDTTGKSAAEFSVLANGESHSPDWSPSGDRIIFSQGGDPPWLATRQYPHRNTFEFKIAETFRPAYDPKYSFDGMWLAFESVKDGNHDIYVMMQNGSQISRLTDDPAVDFQPSWKPGK